MAKMFSTIPGVGIGIGIAETVVPTLRESLQLPQSALVIIYIVCVIAPTAYLVWQIPNKNPSSIETYTEELKNKLEEELKKE
jgi:hypothetical protein